MMVWSIRFLLRTTIAHPDSLPADAGITGESRPAVDAIHDG
jgi:hypothetical protein